MIKRNSGLAPLTAVSLLLGSFLIALPAQGSNSLNPGSLDLVSSLWHSSGSSPRDLVRVDDTLFFLAETEAHGEELYSYRNGVFTLHEASPGADGTPYFDLFAIEGGVAFTINSDSDFYNQHIGGVFRDGNFDWIPSSRVDGNPDDTYLLQAGEHFFMFEEDSYNQADQLIEMRLDRAVGDIDRYLDLAVEVVGYTDSNQVFQQAFTADWDDIYTIHNLYAFGDFVFMRANVTQAIGNGLYFLDTRNDPSLWIWEPLIEHYPLKDDNGVSVSSGVSRVSIDGDNAYIFFDSYRHIEKFGLDGSGNLQPLEVVSGSTQWEWTEGQFDTEAVSEGTVFFESSGDLHFLRENGSVEQAPDPSDGFSRLGSSVVLDDVLYLITRDQLLAWDLQENVLYPAFESLSLYSRPVLPGLVAVGKEVIFSAESLYGTELMALDTLTDQVRVIDVETAPAKTHIPDVESFEGEVYFFEAGSDDVEKTAFLMKESGGIVSPVKDANGNLFRTLVNSLTAPFPNLIDAVDGTLYFLADENSIANPRMGFYRSGDIKLWALESGSSTPQIVDGPGEPGGFRTLGNLASLLVNEVSQPRLFVAIDDNGGNESHSLFALDTSVQAPQTPSFSALATSGTNFYRSANNEVFVGQGSIYTVTGDSHSSVSSSKIAHLNMDLMQARVLPVTDGDGSNYDSTDLEDLEILKIVGTTDDNGTSFFAHVLGERQNGQTTVALLGLSPSSGGSSGLVTMTHKITDSLLDESELTDVHLIENGPASDSVLVVQFNDGYDSGIAYFTASAVVIGSAVSLPTNSANLISSYGAPLVTSEYLSSVFDPESNTLFVPEFYGDGELTYKTFQGTNLAEATTLSNVTGMGSGENSGGYISGDTYLRLEANIPVANVEGALYFPVTHKDERSALFRFDPNSQASRYNPTIPVAAGNLGVDLGIKFPLRPIGTNANVSLKSNFPGGPGDVILRGAGSVNLNPNAFVRPGFALAGWSETSNGNVDYEANANFGFRSSTKLYAVWEQSSTVVTVPTPVPVPVPVPIVATGQAKVSFVTPDNLAEPATQVAKSGEVLILPELTQPGYEFEGWSETATGPIFAGAYRPIGNVELHARFSPINVKVFFAPQAGVKLPTSITFTSGTELVLPNPSKRNFTFTGWMNLETGKRIPKGWLPTEATMLSPMFKAGSPDHQVRFWSNSSSLSKFQLGRLGEFASDFAAMRGTKSLLITGFDSRNGDLARKRALNTAIKLRKLGIKVPIELRVVTDSSLRPITHIVVID